MEIQLGVPTLVMDIFLFLYLVFASLDCSLDTSYMFSLNLGFGQYQGMQGGQHQWMQGVAPAAGLRPPMQRSLPQADGALQPNQQNLRVRGMEGLNTTQHDTGKQDSANSKPEEDAGKKGISFLLFIPTYTILLQVSTLFYFWGVI